MKTPPRSRAKGQNPKDLLAVNKISISKFPAVALLHASDGFMDGDVKYGPYNWRDKPVIASIYVDACERHVRAWFEGEEIAADSGVHHLGHAIACLAILLDAQEVGNLVDDRPVNANATAVFSRVLARLSARRAPRPAQAKGAK